MYTVKMNAPALRSLMGDAFDYTLFEQGRQDARACQRQFEIVRKRRRNFVVFRQGG